MKKYLPLVLITIFSPLYAKAHCPLCTVGAGFLAVTANSLGVPSIIVASFIGGFATALSLWVKNLIKKEYFKFQNFVVIILVYLSTIIPLYPLLREYKPLYISFVGEYGTTYATDVFVFGIIIGTIGVWIAPYVSRSIRKINKNRQVPYQGIAVTFILLLLLPLLINILLW